MLKLGKPKELDVKETTSLSLMKKIMDMQEDLLVVFCDSKPILANNAFLVFSLHDLIQLILRLL